MNGTLISAARRLLYPALKQSQGVDGTYSRGALSFPLTMIPTSPDWVTELDTGVIEEWEGLSWIVTADDWAETGFDVPEQNDRFTATLADGKQYVFGVLAPKGKQEYDQAPQGQALRVNMKRVKS